MKAHGQTPHPQCRVQASGRTGVSRWRDASWPGEALRAVAKSDPHLGPKVRGSRYATRRPRLACAIRIIEVAAPVKQATEFDSSGEQHAGKPMKSPGKPSRRRRLPKARATGSPTVRSKMICTLTESRRQPCRVARSTRPSLPESASRQSPYPPKLPRSCSGMASNIPARRPRIPGHGHGLWNCSWWARSYGCSAGKPPFRQARQCR